MSDKPDNENDNILRPEFTSRATYRFRMTRDPAELARMLDVLYKNYQCIEKDDDFDEALRAFVTSMYEELGEQPGSKQLEGYISYCEWSLGERSTRETFYEVQAALEEYMTDTMLQAWNDIFIDLGVLHESYQAEMRARIEEETGHVSSGPVALLPAPQPRVKLVQSVDEPLYGTSARRGQLYPVSDLQKDLK